MYSYMYACFAGTLVLRGQSSVPVGGALIGSNINITLSENKRTAVFDPIA